MVAPDRLRFDFTNAGPVSAEQLRSAEMLVRQQIRAKLPVYAAAAALEEANRINGVRAVFGETYPDPVRIVSIGVPVDELLNKPESAEWRSYSIEFCGGTHLANTGDAQEFAIVSEEAVAKGIRRVVALTGVPARAAIEAAEVLEGRVRQAGALEATALAAELNEINRQLDEMTLPAARKDDLRSQVAALQERVKAAQKEQGAAIRQQATGLARSIAEAAGPAERVIVSSIDVGADRQALEQAVRTIRNIRPGAAVMLLSPDEAEGKVSVMATVPEELVKKGLKAGDWVREVTGILGGKGGGRPDSAQGAGPEVGKIAEAAAAARAWATGRAV